MSLTYANLPNLQLLQFLWQNVVLFAFSAAVRGWKQKHSAQICSWIRESLFPDIMYVVSSNWPWSAVSFEISHSNCYGYNRCPGSKHREWTQARSSFCSFTNRKKVLTGSSFVRLVTRKVPAHVWEECESHCWKVSFCLYHSDHSSIKCFTYPG